MSLTSAWLLAVASALGTPTAYAAPAVALRGTLVQSDAQRSQAIVELDGGESWLLGVGGVLPGVGRLVRVEPFRVLLDRGGSLFELSFSGAEQRSGHFSAAAVSSAADQPPATDDSVSNTGERVVPPPTAEDQSVAPVDRSGDAGLPRT
jgi:type II secretory pathway component PulC